MYWLKRKPQKTNTIKKNKFSQWILKTYTKCLTWSLSHRQTILIACIASLIFGLSLIPLIPQGFIPQLDRGEFNIVYTTELPRLPNNSSLASVGTKTNSQDRDKDNSVFGFINDVASNPSGFILRRTRRAGEKIEAAIIAIPEIESTFNTVGFRGQPNLGKIYLKLKDDRNLSTIEGQNIVREKLPTLKGVDISVEDIKFVDTGNEKPFSLALVSDNLTSLYQTTAKVDGELSKLSALKDLSYSPSNIDAQEINNLLVIEHRRGQPAVTFTANLAEGEALGEITDKVITLVQPLLDNDVNLSLGGDSARMMEVIKQFSITFVFSLVMMLLVLWALFGSLLEPIVVALSLPLSIVGAMIALLVSQSDFGMISLLALIFLVGLLDKNALLLVDYTNQLRRQGKRRHDAIILSCQTRLRPILMTSLSTILAMLPLAIGLGAGAQLRQPMAVAIIGGLITSSVLSLIVVPVFYTLLEDIWKR